MSQVFEFDLLTPFNRTSLNISEKDFLKNDPNEFYQGADIVWMMVSSALVLLMVPGMGLFYSGVSEKCSALSMMWYSVMTTAVVGIQWYLWGYTIAFTGNGKIWGGTDSFAFSNDLSLPWAGHQPGTKIPQLVHALFQGMFACFTATIVSGAAVRKGRPVHFLVFIFLWSTFVYNPIARSTWNPVGWANYWKGDVSGVFDFAGGTVVHITSASSAAIYSVFFKWRRQMFSSFGSTPLTQPQKNKLNREFKHHNVVSVILGTALLWIGWFGFNGGSALGANLRAVSACVSTHLAACAGGVTGTLLEYYAASKVRADKGKFSIVGFCNGAIAGLVAITPAAGYVPYWSAPIFGIIGSFLCSIAQGISEFYFDTNDVFVIHGIAGWAGMLFTAAFARADVAFLDGYTIIKNHGGLQLAIQISDALVGMVGSGVGTFIILTFMEIIQISYRKIRGIQEPEFQLIVDEDILLARELGGQDDLEQGQELEDFGMANSHGSHEGVGGLDIASVPGEANIPKTPTSSS